MPKYTSPQKITGPSFFLSCREPSNRIMDWDDVVKLIRSDQTLDVNTTLAREKLQEGNSKSYDYFKRQAPAIAPACQIVGKRSADNVVSLTGIAMVDIDHIAPDQFLILRSAITQDPHTFLAYTTLSGAGIRILYPYRFESDDASYLDAWRYGNQYFSLLLHTDTDEAVKDLTRLSFLAHDPEVYFNPDATPFIVSSQKAKKKEMAALHKAGLDQGMTAYFGKISEILARQGNTFTEGNRHHYAMEFAMLANKMGLDPKETEQELSNLWGSDNHELRSIIDWVYNRCASNHGSWNRHTEEYATRHQQVEVSSSSIQQERDERESTSRSRRIKPDQIADYLSSLNNLRKNVITENTEILDPITDNFIPITDDEIMQIWQDACTHFGQYVAPTDFDRVFKSQKAFPRYDPFKAFFERLSHIPLSKRNPILDLSQRVHTTADDQLIANPFDPNHPKVRYFDYCFAKWFVSMVASWHNPKVLNQTILTLIGEQGIYKSTFFRRLLPPELESYFLAKTNSAYPSKDDKIALSSYALIDIEEIDAMSDSVLNSIKALVTTEVIAERAAYARNRENRPHLASFCATGNNKTFLTDLSGNRRWLPFEVTSIDDPYTNPIDYDELYAYANHLYKNGFQYWFDRKEDLFFEDYKKQFVEPCLEEELLHVCFRKPLNCQRPQCFTASDILNRINAYTRNILSLRKLIQLLKREGFDTRNHRGRTVYLVIENSPEEINRRHDPLLDQQEE